MCVCVCIEKFSHERQTAFPTVSRFSHLYEFSVVKKLFLSLDENFTQNGSKSCFKREILRNIKNRKKFPIEKNKKFSFISGENKWFLEVNQFNEHV